MRTPRLHLHALLLIGQLAQRLPSMAAAPPDDPLNSWHTQGTDTVLNGVVDAKFAAGRWVTLRNSGEILASTEGRTWLPRYAGPGIIDVAMAGDRLAAVSLAGSIFASDPVLSLRQSRPGEVTVRRGAGIPVALESSEDLVPWESLTELPLGAPIESVTDPRGPASPRRFYRAMIR